LTKFGRDIQNTLEKSLLFYRLFVFQAGHEK